MTETSSTTHLRRFATDALGGLGVFVLLTTMVAGSGTFAATFSFPEPDAISLAGASGGETSILMLGLVFSLLFAFNAAFFRHLGRTYAKATKP